MKSLRLFHFLTILILAFLLSNLLTSCGKSAPRDRNGYNMRNGLNGNNQNGLGNNGNLNANYSTLPCLSGLRFNLEGNLGDKGQITTYTKPSVTGKSSIYINAQTRNKVEIQGADNDRLVVKANVCVQAQMCTMTSLKVTAYDSNNTGTFKGVLSLYCDNGVQTINLQ